MAAAEVDDGSAGSHWAAVVGLEAFADQVCVGVHVVSSVGVKLHEHQQPVGAFTVLQPVGPRLDRGADRVAERVQW